MPPITVQIPGGTFKFGVFNKGFKKWDNSITDSDILYLNYSADSEFTEALIFTCSGTAYSSIHCTVSPNKQMYYVKSDGTEIKVWENSAWVNESYKIIVFESQAVLPHVYSLLNRSTITIGEHFHSNGYSGGYRFEGGSYMLKSSPNLPVDSTYLFIYFSNEVISNTTTFDEIVYNSSGIDYANIGSSDFVTAYNTATGAVNEYKSIKINTGYASMYYEDRLSEIFEAVTRLSVDVSTLAGWDALSAGSHAITVVAKASGYKDSEPSASVSVTKAASTKTLKAGTYQFVESPTEPNSAISTMFDFLDANESSYFGIRYTTEALDYFTNSTGSNYETAYDYHRDVWGNSSYRTITLVADQQVSADFYAWAIEGGNLVEQPSMPAKGDIITLDSKQYRVLKTEGTVAEVLAMYDATDSQIFGSSQTYANSDLDTYCNTTFYNSLSSVMQAAIVAKTFQQDSWQWSDGSSAIANYAGTYQTTNNYILSLRSTTFGSSISRKCYVLSCQDVIDYLGVTTSMGAADTTLTSENIWKMFWNQISSPGSRNPWTRSSHYGDSVTMNVVSGTRGSTASYSINAASRVRPAFQIDLSKISWS